jgi:hypothetical protein
MGHGAWGMGLPRELARAGHGYEWALVISYWLLVIGYWLCVIGYL